MSKPSNVKVSPENVDRLQKISNEVDDHIDKVINTTPHIHQLDIHPNDPKDRSLSSFSCGQSFGRFGHEWDSIKDLVKEKSDLYRVKKFIDGIVEQQHELTQQLVLEKFCTWSIKDLKKV